MSKSTYGVRRAGLASLATMSLVTAAAVAGAGAASAVTDFKFQRIGGADRYETSADIADAFATTNPDVILANGEPGNYADALSANTLAGELNVPILLTKADKTPDFILAQLAEDGVKNITVVGGESVVTPAQVASLESKGYKVTRVSGSDRFLTNAEVIKKSGAAKANTGLIATGFNFPDALAAGPVSFVGHPLGLSTGDDIDQEVIDALKGAGVTKVLIFGGNTAVSPAVEAKLTANGITVTKRFAGTDRSDTSVQAAEYAVTNLGFTNKHVGVASGYVNGFGADALAGGPLEGKENSPMLVTRDVNNPDNALDYLKAHANTLVDGHLYGGPAAISTAAQAAMEKAAQSETTNEDFTVTPSGAQAKEASATAASNEGRTSFTVTGLDDTKKYDISLFPCDNVTRNAAGIVSFKDAENTDADPELEGDNKADGQNSTETGAAKVENVNNGAPVTDGITPVNGTITFTVDSTEADCAVAVLFEDTADDDTLNLDANNRPVEDFVATGELSWTAREATTGDYTGVVATSTDEANNMFGGDTNANGAEDKTFAYDSNDVYKLPGLSGASMAQFENALTVGDTLTINYNSDPGGVSTFEITTNTTPAPTSVTASVQNNDGDAVANDVLINWTPGADTPSGTTYEVTRYAVTPNADGTCPTATDLNSAAAGTVTDTTDTDTTATDEDRTAGCYAYKVTATSPNGGTDATSPYSNTVKVNAVPVPDNAPPTLAGAQANDVNNSTGSTNQVRYTFDEPVKVLDATKFSVTGGGITFNGVSATVSGSTVIVTLDGTLQDAPSADDVTYTADVAASAVEDAAGNDNAADSATFAY